MTTYTVEVNERELRTILSAFDLARDRTRSDSWGWWHETAYANRLYFRLRSLGFETPEPVDAALDSLVADGALEEAS